MAEHLLRRSRVVEIHATDSRALPTIEAAARVFAAWFASPYWLAEGVGVLAAGIPAGPCSGTASGALAASSWSRAIHRGVAADTAVKPSAATALADRYHLGRYGSLSTGDYEHVAAAIAADEPAAWHLRTSVGSCVAASTSELLAWLLGESLREGFPVPVAGGAAEMLATFATGAGPIWVIDIAALVPTPSGVARREALVAAEGLAAPAAAYPLAITLLPEASPRLVPTTSSLSSMLPSQDGHRQGHLVRPSGSWGREIQAGRSLTARIAAARAEGAAAAVRGIRTTKRAAERTPLWGVVRRRDGAWSSRESVSSRLAARYTTNPWLSTEAESFLDEAARVGNAVASS